MGGSNKYTDYTGNKRNLKLPKWSTAKDKRTRVDPPSQVEYKLYLMAEEKAARALLDEQSRRMQALMLGVPTEPTPKTQKIRALPRSHPAENGLWAMAIPHGCVCPTCAKRRALHQLWSKVVTNMVFMHPDPGAKISLEVRPFDATSETVFITFRMNVLDTEDPRRQKRMGDDFYMTMRVSSWPGEIAAEFALVGAWMGYIRHETLELVRRKVDPCPQPLPEFGWRQTPLRPEWHPHSGTVYANDTANAINTAMYGAGTNKTLGIVAKEVIGDEADRLFNATVLLAAEEQWDTRARIEESEDQ